MLHLSLLLTACAFSPPNLGTAAPSVEDDERAQLYVPARRWALVIGASGHRHLGRLEYAAGDATNFADTLIERFAFEPSTVRLMTDDAEDPDLRPTAGNMFLQLRRLLADERLQ